MMKRLSLFVFLIALGFLLIACQTPQVTVTFETNGGPTIESITLDKDSKLTEPLTPIRDGYDFDGWFKEATFVTEWSFTLDTVTSNITLYAKWIVSVPLYTVTFMNEGIELSQEQVLENGFATEPVVSKEGHYLDGWFTSQDQGATLDQVWVFSSSPVTSNTTLYAKWVPNPYVINFTTNGGSTIQSITVYHGDLLDVMPPTRIGYTFDGWYTDAALNNAFNLNTPITSTLRLYAKWSVDLEAIQNFILSDVDSVSFGEGPITQSAISFPAQGPNGSNILWTSSNTEVINRYGVVFHPRVGEDDVTVTITGRFVFGPLNQTYTWDLVVPAKTDVTMHESALLPFTNMTGEYEVANSNLLTFYAQNKALPYVDIQQFLSILDGLLHYDELEFAYLGHIMTISYQVEYEVKDDQDQVIDVEIYDYIITIDFEANTITVESLDAFGGYIKSTATDYSAGLTYLETYSEAGNSVTFELNPYRFDLVIHEEGDDVFYLFPFHIANLLFTSSSYYNVYYNGDGYFGIYAFPDKDDPQGNTEGGRAYNAMKASSKNGENIDSDVLVSTYDFLAFTLDYLFGLKSYREIESYYSVLRTYRDQMMTGTTSSLSQGIFNFVYKGLDDLHSSFHFPGYYEQPTLKINLTSINQLGNHVAGWYDTLWAMQDVHKAAYPTRPGNTPPDYRFIDNQKTAIIYLDGFYTATVEDPDGKDSDKFMKNTLNAIFLANPAVENIVIDLSYNTGGNIGALLRVLGYMTEQPIEMSYMNPTDGSNATYFIDVATVAYTNVNWFFITSRVTFSAANLMASIGQHMGFATILGTQTGGGASSITPIVLPDGTMIHMSSLNVLSYRVGNEVDGYTYFSIENGITPDVVLRVADTQNADKIKEAIQQALSSN